MATRVESITVIAPNSDVMYGLEEASCWFWEHLFAYLQPRVITLVAQPVKMGVLIGIPICERKQWAFDMPYHFLRLARENIPPPTAWLFTHAGDNLFEKMNAACRWTSIRLNEGSFKSIQADKVVPPSLLYSASPDRRQFQFTIDRTGITNSSYLAISPPVKHLRTVRPVFWEVLLTDPVLSEILGVDQETSGVDVRGYDADDEDSEFDAEMEDPDGSLEVNPMSRWEEWIDALRLSCLRQSVANAV